MYSPGVFQEAVTAVRRGEFESAAGVVVKASLALEPGERLVVLSDTRSAPIASALARAASRVGAMPLVVDLDQLGPRPHKVLSDYVVSELSHAQASAFVAQAPHGELGMRQHLLHLVEQYGLRHAHMPGVSPLAFTRGMRASGRRIARYGRRLLETLETSRYIETHSPAGTQLRIALGADTRWFAQLGTLEPGRWGNLPAGALYASPELVEGTFVANASLGEYFGKREGLLIDTPVRLHIQQGRVQRVETSGNATLARDLEQMIGFAENSDRVGLVAVGVNVGLDAPTGEALVDQNLPGLHIAIGDPAAHATGVAWSARTSFAACQAESTVLADGALLVSRGKLMAPTGSVPAPA